MHPIPEITEIHDGNEIPDSNEKNYLQAQLEDSIPKTKCHAFDLADNKVHEQIKSDALEITEQVNLKNPRKASIDPTMGTISESPHTEQLLIPKKKMEAKSAKPQYYRAPEGELSEFFKSSAFQKLNSKEETCKITKNMDRFQIFDNEKGDRNLLSLEIIHKKAESRDNEKDLMSQNINIASDSNINEMKISTKASLIINGNESRSCSYLSQKEASHDLPDKNASIKYNISKSDQTFFPGLTHKRSKSSAIEQYSKSLHAVVFILL